MNTSFEIQLTDSMLKNHRIYFDSELYAKFFPNDSFGEREEDGKRGNNVLFIAGGDKYETDIINKKEGKYLKRINPRKSFTPYLNSLKKSGVVAGQKLSITREGDRLYRLDCFSKLTESPADLKAERKIRLASASKKPERKVVETVVFVRNPDVVDEVLERANGICEKCENKAPFFRKSDNSAYLEVHHKIRLADDGDDTVENAIALCPNCHREAHYG